MAARLCSIPNFRSTIAQAPRGPLPFKTMKLGLRYSRSRMPQSTHSFQIGARTGSESPSELTGIMLKQAVLRSTSSQDLPYIASKVRLTYPCKPLCPLGEGTEPLPQRSSRYALWSGCLRDQTAKWLASCRSFWWAYRLPLPLRPTNTRVAFGLKLAILE